MKKLSVFILFVFITTLAFAQNKKNRDVIYLKNGSVIRGRIIEQVPDKSVKIETANRNVFVYKTNEIKKIIFESPKSNFRLFSDSASHRGYKAIIETGYGIGLGDNGLGRVNLNIINGYQFNPYFSMGFGTGLRYYFDSQSVLIPFFADFRGYFMNSKKFSPYVSLDIGYSFDATNNFEGVGVLVNPSVGAAYKISDQFILNLGVGYEMQGMKSYENNLSENEDNFSRAININAGISFFLSKHNK